MNINKISVRQILLVAGLVGSLIISTTAMRRFILPVPKADKTIKKAALNLHPPYIRLAQSSVTNNLVSIDVNANTNGIQTIAADIYITYNPQVLDIDQSGIKLSGTYAISNFSKVGDGIVSFSLFSNPERDEPTLVTEKDQEVTISTLLFSIKNKNVGFTEIQINFLPGRLNETNLIRAYLDRPEKPEDILQNTQGITITF